ncbi:MAG: hypothetical protein HOB63_02080 [Opitutae bacterium]|nr:hypothetical protein [Opitutae bacterium]
MFQVGADRWQKGFEVALMIGLEKIQALAIQPVHVSLEKFLPVDFLYRNLAVMSSLKSFGQPSSLTLHELGGFKFLVPNGNLLFLR